MQFSEHWLREFVNPPLTSAELARSLTMAGLEVEALAPVAAAFRGVVVAHGGMLELENARGGGAVLRILLPPAAPGRPVGA